MISEGEPLDCRVLIVEDNLAIGRGLKAALEEAGAWVVWAQTDQAAYTVLEAGLDVFDILLLDVDLGVGTTGFDIARFARGRRPSIGIIFSSGTPPDWMSSFGVPDALFVPKPSTQKDLLAAIAVILSDREVKTSRSANLQDPKST